MSRTFRTHNRPQKKEGRPLPVRVPSPVALGAVQRTGAGFHGKCRKAERRAERVAVKAGRWE